MVNRVEHEEIILTLVLVFFHTLCVLYKGAVMASGCDFTDVHTGWPESLEFQKLHLVFVTLQVYTKLYLFLVYTKLYLFFLCVFFFTVLVLILCNDIIPV